MSSFTYPRNDECNPRMQLLPGMNTDYSGLEARMALAIADALGSIGVNVLPAGNRTEFSTTIGTSNTVLFAADAGRTYFRIQNLSCEVMYVRFGDVAAPTDSYILHPGGYIEDQITQEITQSINVLSTGTSSNIYGFVLSTT